MIAPKCGWPAVRAGPRLPLIKVAHLDEPAEKLKRGVIANLSAQPRPEFCDIVVVRDRLGISDRTPPWIRGFLEHIWS
jgi:hypothetical protein